MSYSIDLNCDMGESFGPYQIGQDEKMFPYISSANIACGFHGGDFRVMDETVRLAVKHHVTIGAHPSFPDLQGFGRREMSMTPKEVYQMILYQVGALQAFVRAHGTTLHHVKPHGALYNLAAKKGEVAEAIAEAVYQLDSNLILYGLANSELIAAAKRKGLRVGQEAFADRTYQDDGSLTPRNINNALIEKREVAITQVIGMIKNKRVTSVTGKQIHLDVDTICLHGDGEHAVNFARHIKEAFEQENIKLNPVNG
ncbi:UPF0271 protein [Salirhabdus euzebyi]|uniref:5-oxoprolinase subunit A n=1 Tax=Salirhabdus euzebyi TaxID=394506 RepID=A0A841Q5H5_9BACI|nr:5-oxoprolinase subunit PxpA [Salirhabdus euzebyi]MBB6453640.1 UPF0271 protein [Salirhabdus euzebyi]